VPRPNKFDNIEMIGITLTPELKKLVFDEARRLDQPATRFVRRLIRAYFDNKQRLDPSSKRAA
jgi:hypothetical protein